MLHPSELIREKGPNTWHRDRMEGLVLVGKDFRVVRRRSPTTNAFIMCNEDLPKKELYATKRMVHITEEVTEEDFFYLGIPSLESSIASTVVPL